MSTVCDERRFRRHVYVTPKSYLSFLAGFRDLYERKLAHVRGLASAIAAGLAKMKERKVDVGRMKARSVCASLRSLLRSLHRRELQAI